MRKIEEILPEITLWKDKTVTYEPLSGGLSNVTYKICADGELFVLRINGNDFLGLDRMQEAEACRKAHGLGIGAEVIFAGREVLITRFLPGTVLSRLNARRPEYVQKLAKTLKSAHSITGIARNGSALHLIMRYLDGAGTIPGELSPFLRKAERIERERVHTVYCHNDAVNLNIIDCNGGLTLIDWEMSGRGNAFFDLAAVSLRNAYTPDNDKLLLTEYFGYYEDEFAVIMNEMRFMVTLREAAWALLHQTLGTPPPNPFFSYGECWANALRRMNDC